MKFKLVEFISSESHYKNGERIRIKITSQNKELNRDDIDKLSQALCNIYLNLDVLIDNSDGTYELCIPTHQDWMKILSDKVQNILNDKANIEII